MASKDTPNCTNKQNSSGITPQNCGVDLSRISFWWRGGPGGDSKIFLEKRGYLHGAIWYVLENILLKF